MAFDGKKDKYQPWTWFGKNAECIYVIVCLVVVEIQDYLYIVIDVGQSFIILWSIL